MGKVIGLYARVAHIRREQHQKIAVKWINRYRAIAVESLNIQGMIKNHRLACVIQDSGWSRFLAILRHEAESVGVRIFEVNARGTSQTCPACGVIVKKALSQRWHKCECGYATHRDHAAAQVIFARDVLAGIPPGSLNVDVGWYGSRAICGCCRGITR